jgi:hypothetical protein
MRLGCCSNCSDDSQRLTAVWVGFRSLTACRRPGPSSRGTRTGGAAACRFESQAVLISRNVSRRLAPTDACCRADVPQMCPPTFRFSAVLRSFMPVPMRPPPAPRGATGPPGPRVDRSGCCHDCCHRSPAASDEEVRGPGVSTAQPGAGQRQDDDRADPNLVPLGRVQFGDGRLVSR